MTTFTATRDEATAAILGAVLLSPDAALDIATTERIRPDHFPIPRERALYQAMLALNTGEQAIDPITLAAQAEQHWPKTEIDVRAAIELYAGGVPFLGNLRGYCRIAREHAWYAQATRACLTAVDAAEHQNKQGVLSALSQVDTTDSPEPTRSQATEFLEWYENDRKGIPLPFDALTEAVGGGLQAGEVSILGGWPGMGKTFFAKDTMLNAKAAGVVCHEYANEMSGPRLTARLISSLCGIPAPRIRNRQLNDTEWKQVLAILKNPPYETTPSAGWTPEDYCRDIRKRRPDLAVIDTVTNLPCSKTDEWDRACGMLADTAANTGTHLILLSQLNKERDTGQVKPPPTGRDLRNTGAWYMRARVVMFVHRDQELVESTGIVRALSDGHIRVEKATHGEPEVGYVAVTFNPKWLRFDDLNGYGGLEAVA